jgi:hypothetical protein
MRNRWQPHTRASAAACTTTTQAASPLPPHAPSPPQPRTALPRHHTPHVRVVPLPLMLLPPPWSRPRVIVLSWSDGTRGSHAALSSQNTNRNSEPQKPQILAHKEKKRNIDSDAELQRLQRRGIGASRLGCVSGVRHVLQLAQSSGRSPELQKKRFTFPVSRGSCR